MLSCLLLIIQRTFVIIAPFNVYNVSGEASIETQSLTSCEESSVNSDVALKWYVDSGATNHMTNDVNILSDVHYHEKPTPVYLGDKSVVLSSFVNTFCLQEVFLLFHFLKVSNDQN